MSAAPSLEECASECEADPVCTGATYFGSDTVLNCWFKDWGAGSVAPPCLRNPQDPLEVQAIIDPAGVACSDITYMDIAVYVCDEELLIDEKPSGVAPGTESSNNVTSLSIFSKYDRFPGRDYNPGSPQSDFEVRFAVCLASFNCQIRTPPVEGSHVNTFYKVFNVPLLRLCKCIQPEFECVIHQHSET